MYSAVEMGALDRLVDGWRGVKSTNNDLPHLTQHRCICQELDNDFLWENENENDTS